MKYKVIWRKDTIELSAVVTEMLAEGWQLIGGVAYGGGGWAQAMVDYGTTLSYSYEMNWKPVEYNVGN